MSTLKLKGSTSGYVDITAPAVSGNHTITLPNSGGTIAVKDASNNLEVGTGVTMGSPTSNTFTISTNGSERVRVDSSGKLGIGTINPTTELQVVGVVSATSYRGDGSQLTGLGGAAAVTVLTSDTTLTKGNAYMINAPGIVLTLPASPSTGDAVDILNNVSGIHTLARNGSTIMSLSEDMTFGEAGLKFKVWYTGSTWSLF